MTLEQALQLISQLCAMAPVPLATHLKAKEALEVIQKAVKDA